ncbi:hypothetical protein ACVWWJ_003362 [Luteibacter sp. HA06]
MVKTSLTIAALLLSLTSLAYGATMKNPDIKLNPNPRMRYEITAVVQGAPGPFDRIEGAVQYKVTDRQCVPLTPITGAAQFPEKRVPIELHRVDDHTFKGDLYVDLLRDEDYFGMGICHWNLIGADVSFKVNELYFSPSLFHDELIAGKPVIRFFSDRSYELSATQRVDTGNSHREDFKEDADRTFSIELTAKEKAP